MNEAFLAINVGTRHDSELIIHLGLLLGKIISKIAMLLQSKAWHGSSGKCDYVAVIITLTRGVVETQFIACEFLVCELVPSGKLLFGQGNELIPDLIPCGDSFNHA